MARKARKPERSKHTDKFPVSNLDFMHGQRKLLLRPKYQREEVWTLSQKQLLIDSLLNGFDVPKLYFRKISKDGYEYEVVDGQQRLTTIFGFLANAFKLSKDADEVAGCSVAARTFSDIDLQVQMKLRNVNLDVVELIDYSDDDVEDLFLRLQNGTPLRAAEKRRAIAGNMRNVVSALARHKVFTTPNLVGFTNKHAAHEDAAAQSLHLLLKDEITDIKPLSIELTYENHAHISEDDKDIKRLKAAWNFIVKAFKETPNPKLKKGALLTLTFLVAEMLEVYDLGAHPSEFGSAYLDFETRRTMNSEKDEKEQDPALVAYTGHARSDTIPALKFRHETLLAHFVQELPTLATKDPKRAFTEEQRLAIFWRDKGICQSCGTECKETEFHADHKKSHKSGGKTSVENGQVLCIPCNLKKGGA